MMNRWTEANLAGTGLTSSALLSVVVHMVLIAAAVAATSPPDIQRREIPEVSIARFLAPPNRQGGQMAQREMLRFVALAQFATDAPGAKLGSVEETKPAPEHVLGRDPRDAAADPEITGPDSVFTILEVDSAATRYAWSAAPAYPAAMLKLKREGHVKAEWVVDEAGYADTTSLRIVEHTARAFADAVRDALPFMRFSPAKMGAKPVRQRVEQEFTFRISTVIAGAKESKKPES